MVKFSFITKFSFINIKDIVKIHFYKISPLLHFELMHNFIVRGDYNIVFSTIEVLYVAVCLAFTFEYFEGILHKMFAQSQRLSPFR